MQGFKVKPEYPSSMHALIVCWVTPVDNYRLSQHLHLNHALRIHSTIGIEFTNIYKNTFLMKESMTGYESIIVVIIQWT